MEVIKVVLQMDDNLKVEIRRNLSVSVACTLADDSNMKETLKKLMGEITPEMKEAEERQDRLRRHYEEEIWKQIQEMPKPPVDPLGNPVTRETHRIEWDYTFTGQYDANGIEHIYLYPYIEPIKSEYDK